jgi:hypothetical protein
MKTRFRNFEVSLSVLGIFVLLSIGASADCGGFGQPGSKLKPQSWLSNESVRAGSLQKVSRGEGEIVGFWRVTLTSKGNSGLGIPDGAQVDHGFAQWHSDGTEIMNSNRQPSTGSFCLGIWKKVGPRRYALNHFAIAFDDGVHQSYANIREDVVLSQDGDSFAGSFVIAIFDVQGNPGPAITGEITGTRVKLNTTIQEIL